MRIPHFLIFSLVDTQFEYENEAQIVSGGQHEFTFIQDYFWYAGGLAVVNKQQDVDIIQVTHCDFPEPEGGDQVQVITCAGPGAKTGISKGYVGMNVGSTLWTVIDENDDQKYKVQVFNPNL